jgi:hypothetical protein
MSLERPISVSRSDIRVRPVGRLAQTPVGGTINT